MLSDRTAMIHKTSIHDTKYSNVGQLGGSLSQHWSINFNLWELNNDL